MAIRNEDGSEYKLSGSLQQFDPENTEHDLFNLWDQEAIEIGGSPLFYYEIFININTIDELYVEDRGKMWSNHPKCFYGFYEPLPSQNYMSQFGVDSPNEMMFEVNYRHIIQQLGHAPRIGARIYSPQRRENWQVIQRNAELYQMWGQLRMQIMCRQFQENLTTGEGKVTQKEPDFNLNQIKDLGNQSC